LIDVNERRRAASPLAPQGARLALGGRCGLGSGLIRIVAKGCGLNRSPRASKADLSGFPIFSALDAGTCAALAAAGTERRWAGGSTLFQRGDEGSYMVALTAGRVKLSLTTAAGRELVLRHVGPGDVIGELAVIDGHARSADAVAVSDTEGLVFRRDRFREVAATHAAVGLALATYLCGLLRSTNFQMESIALYDLRQRLARFLLLTLRQRYGGDIPASAAIVLGLNQSDLSLVLGASRPKVNQALQELLAEGALRRDGERLICDLALLEEIADMAELDELPTLP
jgi:CRP/FNR family cyclic AMP-dependent transcriptional regulator